MTRFKVIVSNILLNHMSGSYSQQRFKLFVILELT